ncbi:MAG: hypothetical protein ACKOC8_01940 [Pirellulales bacterium]
MIPAAAMRSMRRHVAILLTGIVGAVGPPAARGQDEAPSSTPDEAREGFEERYRKAEILASPRWRRAMFELDQWLAVQPVSTPTQVRQIKAALAERVARMSSYELDYLLDTLDFKLRVLESPEAIEAREWLGRYLSVMADDRRAAALGELPDVVEMTAGELLEGLRAVEEKRAAVERESRRVVRGRQEFGAFVRERRAADEMTRSRMSRIRRGDVSFSPYRGQPVADPPFADAWGSPTVIGVGPWGTFVGNAVGAF